MQFGLPLVQTTPLLTISTVHQQPELQPHTKGKLAHIAERIHRGREPATSEAKLTRMAEKKACAHDSKWSVSYVEREMRDWALRKTPTWERNITMLICDILLQILLNRSYKVLCHESK